MPVNILRNSSERKILLWTSVVRCTNVGLSAEPRLTRNMSGMGDRALVIVSVVPMLKGFPGDADTLGS